MLLSTIWTASLQFLSRFKPKSHNTNTNNPSNADNASTTPQHNSQGITPPADIFFDVQDQVFAQKVVFGFSIMS